MLFCIAELQGLVCWSRAALRLEALCSGVARGEEHADYVQGRCIRDVLRRGVEGGLLVRYAKNGPQLAVPDERRGVSFRNTTGPV